jgi:pectate lyase
VNADRRPALPAAALLLGALAAWPFAVAAAPDMPAAFLAQARSRAAAFPVAASACGPATAGAGGLVSEDPRPLRVEGEAGGVTGGLGRPLFLVTSAEDPDTGRSRPEPGTLRAAVEGARRGGGWIAFDPRLDGSTLRLSAPLRVPSDTTIDGGCGGVTISAAPRTTSLLIANAGNIVIRGLRFTKDAYIDTVDRANDAIGLTGRFDRVAILHNAFTRCGDGCLDIVSKDPQNAPSRVTVAFNHFANHNKVILIGTLTCYVDRAAPGCDDPLANLSGPMTPFLRVTLQANVFEDTAQRQPKVVTNAFVHSVNNLIVLGATRYPNGRDSAVYAGAAASGGVLAAEGDIVVNPTSHPRLGAGPVSALRGADGEARETDGSVAVRGNVGIGAVRVLEHRPEIARALRPDAVGLVDASADPVGLAACLLRVAGPRGATLAWPAACRAGR